MGNRMARGLSKHVGHRLFLVAIPSVWQRFCFRLTKGLSGQGLNVVLS